MMACTSGTSSGSIVKSGLYGSYREVRRPFSGRSRPRTVATSAGYLESEIICAVSEARGITPTIGLAFVNVTTCEAVLCQFTDTQTYARTCHKIRVFEPSQIIFATTTTDSTMLSIIEENLAVKDNNIQMTAVDRRHWSESAGHDYILRLAFAEDLESLKLSIAGNFYAICSFAAAMHHVQTGLTTSFVSGTLRIKFEPSEGTILIDTSTIASLELVQNSCNVKSKDCLFGLLNQTHTRMGGRMLKSNILQPSIDANKIKHRHDAVAELSEKDLMFSAVCEALRGFVDVDRVLAAELVVARDCIDLDYMEQSVNYALMLKTYTDMIMPVWQALAGAECRELQQIRELCNPINYLDVQNLLEYALNENVHYSTKPTELRNQRVWALKAGTNGFLDVARQTYNEASDEIRTYVGQLQAELEIDLDIKFDQSRQFFLSIKEAEFEGKTLPAVLINIHRNKNKIECQTMDMLKMNHRVKDAHNEIIAMSDQSIQELFENVRSKIHPLFKIGEAIALLDMLASFAVHVLTSNYVRPEILETMAIKSGRHAIRERIQKEYYVPNDVYATLQSRFQIVTGCNMSGKSTYIRSIALMAIMAQIGSFVPADYASLPIVHQIFARVSTDDNVEANVSTFAAEMREMAFILHNIEPRSLVIVDELGRGTSTTDGLAIAIAISEALIESRALVWFVTHFRDLPRILQERAGVVNLHLTTEIAADFSRMKMMYKISDGFEKQKFYGLALARLVSLPADVVLRATQISEELHARNNARKHNAKILATAKRRKLALKLKEQLLQARESDADTEDIRKWLKNIQEEFMIRMGAIEAEETAAETEQSIVLTSERSMSVCHSQNDSSSLRNQAQSRHNSEFMSREDLNRTPSCSVKAGGREDDYFSRHVSSSSWTSERNDGPSCDPTHLDPVDETHVMETFGTDQVFPHVEDAVSKEELQPQLSQFTFDYSSEKGKERAASDSSLYEYPVDDPIYVQHKTSHFFDSA